MVSQSVISSSSDDVILPAPLTVVENILVPVIPVPEVPVPVVPVPLVVAKVVENVVESVLTAVEPLLIDSSKSAPKPSTLAKEFLLNWVTVTVVVVVPVVCAFILFRTFKMNSR